MSGNKYENGHLLELGYEYYDLVKKIEACHGDACHGDAYSSGLRKVKRTTSSRPNWAT